MKICQVHPFENYGMEPKKLVVVNVSPFSKGYFHGSMFVFAGVLSANMFWFSKQKISVISGVLCGSLLS